MVELVELTQNETVLVLGPGPGIGLHAAALRAERAVGVAPSELMLAARVDNAARSRATAARSNSG